MNRWIDAYKVFGEIVDKHFPDVEKVEAEVEKEYRKHEGDPGWDEAWRMWTEE